MSDLNLYKPGNNQTSFRGPLGVSSSGLEREYPNGGGGTTLYAADYFTDTNGTLLTAHSPDINPQSASWELYRVVGGESLQIDSNQAYPVLTPTTGVVRSVLGVLDVGQSDGTLKVDFISQSSGTVYGLITLRLTDSNNYLGIECAPNAINITKRAAGSGSAIATTPFIFANGTTYAIEVTLSGSTITATIDGAHEVTVTDSFNSTATRHGIGTYTNLSGNYNQQRYDNFEFFL